jgi:hypothetical protein
MHDPSLSHRRPRFGCFAGTTPPDAFDTFLVHRPSGRSQKRRDPAVSVAAVSTGKLNDVGCQSHFIT